MAQKSFIPKGFNNPMNGYGGMTPKKQSSDNNIQEYLFLLSEKLNLMNMKINDFQSRNERVLKDIHNRTILLSERIEEISGIMYDNSSISTMDNDDYIDNFENESQTNSDNSSYCSNENMNYENYNNKKISNNKKKSKKNKNSIINNKCSTSCDSCGINFKNNSYLGENEKKKKIKNN